MEVRNIMQTPREICTGCSACANCCPADAVEMIAGSGGFLYPSVDSEKCCNCGKCINICPVMHSNKENKQDFKTKCFAAWSKDDDVRFHSTSGGVFTHLAEAVLEAGGAVVGAAYRSDHLVEHILINSKKELSRLRQSKYVQSDIGTVFREVQKELSNGRTLLFSGTPCQCAGLREYLGRSYDELILCDFICRGVNSPSVYLSYLHELEERYCSEVKRVWFKNKTYGWNNFATKIEFEDGQEYIADRETDPFMLGYIKSKTTLYMRESCYQCRFKGISRPVDITLGDFWGVERQFPDIDTKNGVSAVMIHSEKGERLFDLCRQRIDSRDTSISAIEASNKCLDESVELSKNKEKFYEELNKRYFSKIITDYLY